MGDDGRKVILMMMIIASNSRAHKGEKERGGDEWIWGEKEGNADYGGMVQPSQKHVAQSEQGVEWEFGKRGLRMLAAFWSGIPVSSAETVKVTQEVSIVPRL